MRMIRSKEDFQYYLKADRLANGIPFSIDFKSRLVSLFFPNNIWRFIVSLRKVEYYSSRSGWWFGLLKFLALRKFRMYSVKLGYSIPPHVFGPGLSIAHYGTIVINQAAKVGNNCRLHIGVSIGTEAGYADRAPVIGNNCYIGPGVKIYGNIEIADNVAIGANAVVNKSITESNISVGGIPAKKIGDNVDIRKFVIPAAQLAKMNIDHGRLAGMPAHEVDRFIRDNELQLKGDQVVQEK